MFNTTFLITVEQNQRTRQKSQHNSEKFDQPNEIMDESVIDASQPAANKDRGIRNVSSLQNTITL